MSKIVITKVKFKNRYCVYNTMENSTEISYKIAGEIIFSKEPGPVMKKWREIFGIQQKELAKAMKVSPSVISDYESNRRKNPGINFVEKYVQTLLLLDRTKGSKTIFQLLNLKTKKFDFKIHEFQNGITIGDFAKRINAKVVANYKLLEAKVYGYTLIDSLQVIFNMQYNEFIKLFGMTPQRVLIFTNEINGRAAMTAVRLAPVKPSGVVLHKVKEVDKIAIKLAELEGIPLLTTNIGINELVKNLEF